MFRPGAGLRVAMLNTLESNFRLASALRKVLVRPHADSKPELAFEPSPVHAGLGYFLPLNRVATGNRSVGGPLVKERRW